MSKKNRKQRQAAQALVGSTTHEYTMHTAAAPKTDDYGFPNNDPSPEYQARIQANKWDTNLDEVINFIKAASSEPVYNSEGNCIPGNLYWSWARNMRCKYVSVNFDMRDGAFTLRDQDGMRISLDQLKYQYKTESEK
jgi:hypothetical protein